MRLESKTGSTLELTILGYGDPPPGDPGLGSHLKVQYALTTAGGAWIFTESGIELWSVQWLTDWLERAAGGVLGDDERDLPFSKGLSLTWTRDDAGRPVMRVAIANEYFDPWSRDKVIEASLPLEGRDLAEAAARLREQYRRIPYQV